MRQLKQLIFKPAAPGLQEYVVSLPFDFPEESVAHVLKLLEPLVRLRRQGGQIHIQADGDTVETVLRNLARQIRLL
jgi:hypothetical protein